MPWSDLHLKGEALAAVCRIDSGGHRWKLGEESEAVTGLQGEVMFRSEHHQQGGENRSDTNAHYTLW